METDKDINGPFITVVSVDGGLRCGNKLTVITPTEINEQPIDSSSGSKPRTGIPLPSSSKSSIPLQSSNKPKPSSAIPTLVGVDRKIPTSGIPPPSVSTGQPNKPSNSSATSQCASFVTVVALSDEKQGECTSASSKAVIKSGIPVIKPQKSHLNSKSIVNISNTNGNSNDNTKPHNPAISTDAEDNQVITISNKVKGSSSSPNQQKHSRSSSIIEISSEDNNEHTNDNITIDDETTNGGTQEVCDESTWQYNESVPIPSNISELVTVYRLPGERLGFGLRFEGGVTTPCEKVRHLFIQSCASESPSIKAKTSWGQLNEGDEIIEIESIPVNSMTRMDCIQTLKDASVAVRLFIKHTYTLEELSLLKAQREIAIKKLKSQKKLRGSHEKDGRLRETPSTINENVSKEVDDESRRLSATNSASKVDSHSRNKLNNQEESDGESLDNNHDGHSNNLNEGVTMRSGGGSSSSSRSCGRLTADEELTRIKCQSSKIPKPKSYQNQNALEEEEFLDGNNNNNNFINSHDSSVSVQEESSTSSLFGKLVVQPPRDFADELNELLPEFSHSSSISLVDPPGRAFKVSSSNANPNKVMQQQSNNQQQPVEAQFYLNEMNTLSTSTGTTPTPNSHGSMTTASSSLSLEHFCESDETGSTRSTVISRLSMASSITSLSASFMSVPPISGDNATNVTVSNGGPPHGILHRRKSSITSGHFHPEEEEEEEGGEITTLTVQQSQSMTGEHDEHYEESREAANYKTNCDSHLPLASTDSNYVTTVASCGDGEDAIYVKKERIGRDGDTHNPHMTPLSSLSEIPLEPPLFFQDTATAVAAEAANKKTGESLQIVLNQNKHEVMNLTQKSQPVEPDRVSLNVKGGFTGPKNTLIVTSHGDASTDLYASSTATHHHKNRVGEDGQSAEDASSSSHDLVMRSGRVETNWEQKGILEYDDDDELALLAEELGLDQDDEDLFNTMVAEIDDGSVVIKSSGRGEVDETDVDELIHGNFKGAAPFCKEELQRDQNCSTLVNPTLRRDQTDDCTTSSSSSKSTPDNGSKQKEVTYCNSVQQKLLKFQQASDDLNPPKLPSVDAATPSGALQKHKLRLNTSNCTNDDAPPNNNNRSFSPFVKVVEPIKSQANMQNTSRDAAAAAPDELHFAQHLPPTTNTSSLKGPNGINTNETPVLVQINPYGSQSNANQSKLNERRKVTEPPQAPAPPPRTKGILKTQEEEEDQEDQQEGENKANKQSSSKDTGKCKVAVNEKYSDPQRPASAAIVRIGDWESVYGTVGGYYSARAASKKLEVRRYNSLTLNCSETTSVINRTERKAASKDSVVKRDEHSNKDGYHNDDDDERRRIDDSSSHKDGNLVATNPPAPSQQGQGSLNPNDSGTVTSGAAALDSMESSTEYLRHHHQFVPPTFSRLPPDGDEFPNNYWSDERNPNSSSSSSSLLDKKKLFRSELTLKSSTGSVSSSEELGSPPPLPTTEPPKDDIPAYPSLAKGSSNSSAAPPPLPASVPPIPPAKNMAARRPSFDDRKKLFENVTSTTNTNNASPSKMLNNMSSMNGSTSLPYSPSTGTSKAEEPSKKSVKDKIAMFSSRSSSSEDSADTVVVLPKPISNHVSSSSLSKSTVNIAYNNGLESNGSLSKSSENLLGGSSVGGGSSYGRKGSVDLNPSSLLLQSAHAASASDFKPTSFYATLSNGTGGMRKAPHPPPSASSYNKTPTSSSLYERSQSMIDVGGSLQNNYTNGASYHSSSSQYSNNGSPDSHSNNSSSGGYASLRYNNNNTTNTNNPSRPVSSLMEQRRKCMTKLRGLVIPDVPGEELQDKPGPTASASVVDLPTIISKDAPLISPVSNKPPPSGASSLNGRKSLSRTESLDRFASIESSPSALNNLYNNRSNTLSAKHSSSEKGANDSENNGDWNKFQNVLPKYSPAFKRRGLSAYQTSLSSGNTKGGNTSATPTSNNAMTNKFTKGSGGGGAISTNVTPEPKSLESLTSPRSDSSFEFSSSPSPDKRIHTINTVQIQQSEDQKVLMEKSTSLLEVQVNQTGGKAETPVQQKGREFPKDNSNNNGKLEDSDNDSAVSSSRSSISHGLSPPNSPTPGDSTAATPDPDRTSSREGEDKQEGSGEDSSGNMDESWRILKPQSIEAINRKNVLKSAKFSSGGGELGRDNGGGDDSSLSSSNGKNRRSDDEEASYADAETEDTESSCSELEVNNKTSSPRRMIVAGRINLSQRRDSKADTEEDDEELAEPSQQQSAVHMQFDTLTESPLQAIYDMEMKMAYINEVCDALNDRGRSELSSRYFSRRDSEATVIERPIESKRKLSTDAVDTSNGMDRRARNRSSSGNESDFSSNVSIGSQQNNHKSLSREGSNGAGSSGGAPGVDSDRWSMLEKKYSKSMTSVNMLGVGRNESAPTNVQQHVLSPATSVPKIVTSASEVVEKKIERIIEKTNADGSPKRVTSANIPRGRNDFKSIAEKWQLIEKSSDTKTTTTTTVVPPSPPTTAKPLIPEKPALSPQSSAGSSRSQITSPLPSYTTSSSRSLSKTNSSELMQDESSQSRERMAPRISSSITKSSMEVMENDRNWADKRRSDGGAPPTSSSRSNTTNTTTNSTTESTPSMSSTKRSVSVNDIRRAFEKAEIASYGREDNNQSDVTKKDSSGIPSSVGGSLALPAAHFRVSSFDSTTSEESSATTPAGLYGSSNSLVSSAPRDPYGSITSLASSTSLISPQELQQLIDEANQSLEEAGTPSHEVSVVILHREFAGGSLGITLAGGADYETKEITVHKVLTASIADRDGRIHRGDRILSINGKSTKGLTHREALNLLKSPRTEVVLVISRGRSPANGFQTIEETSALDRAVEPLLNGNLVIENDDDTCYKWGPLKTATLVKDGAGLGFSLEGGKGSIQGDKPLTVKKIFIGGPAEKSGELKVGDLIVSINSVNMSTKSRTEAWNFMKKLSDGEVRICIRSSLM